MRVAEVRACVRAPSMGTATLEGQAMWTRARAWREAALGWTTFDWNAAGGGVCRIRKAWWPYEAAVAQTPERAFASCHERMCGG